MPQGSEHRVAPANVASPVLVRHQRRATVNALKTRPSVPSWELDASTPAIGPARDLNAIDGALNRAAFYQGLQRRFAPPCCAGQAVRAGAAQGGATFAGIFGSPFQTKPRLRASLHGFASQSGRHRRRWPAAVETVGQCSARQVSDRADR